MRAIVTGGAGFIGSHLVEELITQGAEVYVLDNLHAGEAKNIHPQAILHTVDIREKEAKKVILDVQPTVVYHLAAQPDVTTSILKPVEDATTNIIGTINMLEACKEAKVKKVVFASTSAVYGDIQKVPVTEEDVTNPVAFYGLSKLIAESYIKLYAKFHPLSYTILRYANVYGPKQKAKGEGGVVSIFIDKIKNDEPLIIYGDGEQTRDFIHVKDIVKANLAAAEHGDQEIIQVGTSQATSINQLVRMLEQIHGTKVTTIYKRAKTGEIKHSCITNQKAKKVLKWQPQYSMFDGLHDTYLEEVKNINDHSTSSE